MNKIGSFLGLLAILNLLGLVGLVAFLAATGRLDSAKAHAIADLLRHQNTPATVRDQLDDLLEKSVPATAPATSTAPATAPAIANPLAASAEDRLAYARQAMEQERLRLETQAQELQHRQELLDRQQALFAIQRASLEKDKTEFDSRVAASASKIKNENFQKTLALYDTLKPTQIKELFLTIPPDTRVETVADFILAMDPDRSGKIIGEFQTPEEEAFIARVLERIRTAGTASASTSAVPPKSAGS
jgi:hypothetical protein